MELAFGQGVNVSSLQAAWAAGDFTMLPQIQVRSHSDINGAYGAYAAAIDRIFISEEFLNQNAGNVEAIASVILEEIGHAVDGRLNESDSIGDEGAIFSALVRGETLNPQELALLKAEDDSVIVTLDGQVVEIEQNTSTSAAFSFHYDASVTPDDPSLQNIFSTNVMRGTSWSASNGKLTMNTVKLAGLWFGNHATFDRVPWKLGSSLEGNSVSVRAKLLPNSEDWGFYLDDGSYAANVRLFPNELQLAYADRGKNTYSTYSIDTLDFHWYSFSLVNGEVKYYVDGTEVFTGAAYLLTFDKHLIIGDGSGSGDRTTGSFVVDEVFIKNYINNVPTAFNNTLTIAEDTDRIFVASDFNFSDVDPGDSLQAVRINALPTDGTLYIDANNNSIVDTGESFSVGSSITIAAINSGQFKFKPDLNENGTPYTSFNFVVSDGISSSVNPATLTLNVTPVNDAPTNILLTNSNVNENSPNNTIIGQVSVSDPDLNDTHTLTLIDDAEGRFKLVGNQLQVANGSLLDYETNTSHNITIKATDAGNLTLQKDLTIAVINVNEAPTNIQLSKNTIDENSPNGTVIGTLTTTDPDANNTFSYSLVDNANGRFGINGNQLIVADGTKLDYETNQKHTITIRTQDQGGLTYNIAFLRLVRYSDGGAAALAERDRQTQRAIAKPKERSPNPKSDRQTQRAIAKPKERSPNPKSDRQTQRAIAKPKGRSLNPKGDR
jgi:hypothetical protein